MYAGQVRQRRMEIGTGLDDQHNLALEVRQMLERELRADLGQGVDVIGHAQPFKQRYPRWRADQRAQAQSRQADLGQCVHHHQVLVLRDFVHARTTGEAVVGFIQHHQARRCLTQCFETAAVESIGGWIVRTGQKYQRGLAALDSGQHGRQIE